MPTATVAAIFLCLQPTTTDGDTIRCDQGHGQRVRIWGIQAPEVKDPGGTASTRAMRRIVEGQNLTCEPHGKSYSRVVARCFIGRTDIAAEMVRQGQAADWPKFSRGYYAR